MRAAKTPGDRVVAELIAYAIAGHHAGLADRDGSTGSLGERLDKKVETATQRKSENVPPNLAGDWLRAVLTGAPYPLTLLATILMRLRADKDVNGLRVAMLKAVLISRQAKGVTVSRRKEVPVSLDIQNKDPGYLLGRLFAAYEYVQMQALGVGVNATIRDQYYGTASATPRAVFPLLQRKVTHHLARLRKDKPGLAVNLDPKIGEIFELADPNPLFVPTLTAPRQALFAVGYYHQRADSIAAKIPPQNPRSHRHDHARQSPRLRLPLRRDQRQSERRSRRRQPAAPLSREKGLVTDVCLKRPVKHQHGLLVPWSSPARTASSDG